MLNLDSPHNTRLVRSLPGVLEGYMHGANQFAHYIQITINQALAFGQTTNCCLSCNLKHDNIPDNNVATCRPRTARASVAKVKYVLNDDLPKQGKSCLY